MMHTDDTSLYAPQRRCEGCICTMLFRICEFTTFSVSEETHTQRETEIDGEHITNGPEKRILKWTIQIDQTLLPQFCVALRET